MSIPMRVGIGVAGVLLAVAAVAQDPVFPYGAVYFRKSNPPAEDWGRDHATAAKIGVNNFRHWVMWSAIEVAPDKFDWADYDRMLDLAGENGIKVTLAEMITAAPGVDVRQISACAVPRLGR